MAEAVFNIQNAIRTLFALSPLIWNQSLADAAQAFAESQAVLPLSQVSHANNQGQVLICVDNPQHKWSPMKAPCHWLKSEGHRRLLLSDEITEVGCGIAVSGDQTCVVCNVRPIPTAGNNMVQNSICPTLLPL